MNAAELLSAITGDGLTLALDDAGGIRCRGDRAKVNHHLPAIRAHKPELVRLLVGKPSTPAPAEAPANHHPLTEPGLSRLIVGTAQAHGVEPLAVWQWLDVGDIEGLREGEPTHLAAFYVAVGSAVALGQLTPSGHALTPPPDIENATTGDTEPRRGIPTARPLVGAGMVCCGNCGNWTAPHGDGAGRCGREVKPTAAQGPLCRNVPRYCVAFDPTRRRKA